MSRDKSVIIEAKNYLNRKKNLKQMDEIDQVLDSIFCGCGNIEDAENAFRELLLLFEENDWKTYSLKSFYDSEFVKQHGIGFTTLMLYWMNELGLAEHGSSVNGSWLTPLGIEIRKYFV
jgi:hypothetical protein